MELHDTLWNGALIYSSAAALDHITGSPACDQQNGENLPLLLLLLQLLLLDGENLPLLPLLPLLLLLLLLLLDGEKLPLGADPPGSFSASSGGEVS